MKIDYAVLLYIHMNGDFNYNTFSEAAIFVYFIGPVVSIIAIMVAVILVHYRCEVL